MNGLRFLIQRLIDGLHRLVYFLLTPLYAVSHFIGERFARFRYTDDEMAAPKPSRPLWRTILFFPILIPLWIVRRGIPWLFFVTFHPANRKALLLGLPALLVAVVAILALTLSFLYPKERLVGRYERAAYRSFNDSNWDRAQIYYEKLCYLQPSEDRYRYLLALVRERKRELAGAYGIMAGLAPLDQPGFAPAHLWMAEALLLSPQVISLDKRIEPQDRPRLIRYHLEAVLQEMPDHPVALQLKARILEAEDPDQALAIYQRLAEANPRLWMKVAALHDRRDESEARDKVLDRYQTLLEESFQQRPIPVNAYVDYVTCCTMRKDFQRAFQFIGEYAADVRREIVLELQANVLVAWARFDYQTDPDGRLSEVLVHLTQALRIQSGQPQAYALLNEMVQGSPGHRELIRQTCEALVADGINSGMIQVILGSLLLAEGEYERAELTLRLALSLDPNASATLNNLAWLYAVRPEPDYEKARALIDRAIVIDPDRPTYYDTRGKILLKQGDLAAAILDLERAHQAMPDNTELLLACAQVHEALGNLSQAQSYRARLQKILRPNESESAATENDR